jgi:hypothetical protein
MFIMPKSAAWLCWYDHIILVSGLFSTLCLVCGSCAKCCGGGEDEEEE